MQQTNGSETWAPRPGYPDRGNQTGDIQIVIPRTGHPDRGIQTKLGTQTEAARLRYTDRGTQKSLFRNSIVTILNHAKISYSKH